MSDSKVIAQCSLLNAHANAQVGEWLKPADCKSAPPCEVRRFESFPVHHEFSCGKKISDCAGSIRRFDGIGVRNLAGPKSAGRDAGDSGDVCTKDVGAAERRDASGRRE